MADPANAARGDVFVVRTPEQLKVVADPLRLRLLALLRLAPHTVKELAELLDLPPTRLYYHINQLEAHGLVLVAETRLVSGIVEKRYRAGSARLSIDRVLLAAGTGAADPALEAMLSAILDGTREGVLRSAQAGLIDPGVESPREGGLLLGRRWLRLTPERAARLYDRLVELVKEFESEEPTSEAHAYEMLLGLYPTLEDDDA
ncbi:MAG TPA: helix-turn-helix domain-containing protein [Thermomicrobiaceae bacterium]|nr:helix-turn-helix domain-containing protein [Thermomicrobiaceae bacterium]